MARRRKSLEPTPPLIGSWIMAVLTCSWFVNAETGKPDLVA
jgi:hypothetical protein